MTNSHIFPKDMSQRHNSAARDAATNENKSSDPGACPYCVFERVPVYAPSPTGMVRTSWAQRWLGCAKPRVLEPDRANPSEAAEAGVVV